MDVNDIPVIYEDAHLLVVNKPSGVSVHTDGRSMDGTVVDWVRLYRPGIVGVGETMYLQNGSVIDRPGVVHRLDRDTSGVLVLAKTPEAFLHVKKQFQDHLVEKRYHACVWGVVRTPQGTIDRPIGRSRKDFRLWSAGSDAGGRLREAVTRYTVLAVRDGYSYLELEPKTGRTHQLRVHVKAVGHPIVCDARYASKRPVALGFMRLALHAHMLAVTHPNGERVVCEAPFPGDFIAARAYFGLSEPEAIL